MELLWNTIFNFGDAFIYLIIFLFLNQQYGYIRRNITKVVIYMALLAVILYLTDNFVQDAIRLVINILFISLLLGFLSNTSFYSSLIINVMSSIFLFTIELFVLFIFMLILHMDLNTLTSTPQTRIICGITIKVVELILTIILVNSGVKINKLIQYKKSNTLIQLMALQTIVIAILIMCVTSNNSYESNKILYNVSVVFVYILLLGLTMIDFKERERLQTIQNRFRAQEEYIQNIENMLMIIRREKHDFANHLNTILAMCTLNKPDTVTKIGSYINKLSGRLVNAYHFYNTGNDYVDGMLAVKSSLAFEQDIRFEADFNASLKELSLNDCDITCVIGNITDNAFEAIMATGECENKYIAISTYDDNFFYYISISNNGPAICEKDAEKIFSNGYSTKSSNKLDHGFGLFIVEQVVKKNKGVITVSSTEEKTEFLIKFLKEGNAYGKTG